MNINELQSIVDDLPLGLVQLEVICNEAGIPCDYRFVSINRAFEDVIGTQREDLIGYTLREAISNKKISEIDWMDFYDKLFAAGDNSEIEYFSPTSSKWYRVQMITKTEGFITAIFNDVSELKLNEIQLSEEVALLRSITDNSARKQTDEALIESESRNRALLEAIPDLMFVIRKDGVFVDCSFGASNDLLLPPETFLNKHVSEVLPPEIASFTLEYMHRAFSTGQIQSYKYQLELRGKINYFEARMVISSENKVISIVRNITELQEAILVSQKSEKKNRELSTLLRLMADTMPDMLWAKNLNKEYIFANKAICDQLLNAVDTNEPIGKNDLFFAMRERNSHPDNQEWHTFGEICSDSDTLTIQSMKPMQFDEFGNVKGKFLFLDVHKAPLYDDEGVLIGVVGSARDVTAAREAESQLQKLSQAVEQGPASVVITDVEGKIEYVNPSFTMVTGYSLEEVLGQNPRMLKSGIQSQEFYTDLWSTIKSGKVWRGELENKKKNGEVYWESASISPIFDKDGVITHFLAVKENITERKELEEDLKHQTILRELLMEISNGFINIPLEKVDDSINKALEIMALFVNADRSYIFDYDWANKVCHNTYEWCSDGISAEIENLQYLPVGVMGETLENHIKGEPHYVPDVSALPEGPGRVTLESQGIKSFLTVPMMNDNQCIGFVGFDSVRKHHVYSVTEMQLLKIFGQLLANVQLRKEMVKLLVAAKEKAEKNDKLKTSFINNISHEIRTPMNGIIGFGQLLVKAELTDQDRKFLFSNLDQSCKRLLNTINDYMDMALIVSHTIEVHKKDFLLEPFFESISENPKRMCWEKRLNFELNIPEDTSDLIINSDAEYIQKIIGELLDNAIKFTQEGTIACGYRIHSDTVEFFVNDTGCGIDNDMLDNIFEMFTQADTSLTRGYEGSGLGLSIAKGLISLLGGSINVNSEKGKGSEFVFSIPLTYPEGNNTPEQKATIISKNDNQSLLLIAEDDDLNYEYLSALLKTEGYKYIYAKNGQVAVDLCRQHPDITLVLMDIKMPVMNGIEATLRIREFRPHLPIIATTAYAQTGDASRFQAAGCNDYVTKPIEKEKLLSIIRKYCNG